ncbi:MAG: hypothetical protein IKQ44_14150 [Lachnospiraceae bacterium]|nr:hypothetical protein [Lachnospiraceae bacterium]
MKNILVISMMVLMFLSITACGRAEDKQLKDEDTEEKYDILKFYLEWERVQI